METIIHECEAKWGRPAYIKIVDDKVVFDCSDEEYGPIEFDIKLLIKILKDKIIEAYNDGYRDGMTDHNNDDKDISEFDNARLYYNEKYEK